MFDSAKMKPACSKNAGDTTCASFIAWCTFLLLSAYSSSIIENLTLANGDRFDTEVMVQVMKEVRPCMRCMEHQHMLLHILNNTGDMVVDDATNPP